jgi:inorganic triphosphatase YgiF
MARRFEVEWQFDVPDLEAFGRWIVRAPLDPAWTVTRDRTLDLRDAYFDTEGWRVLRAGYALRIRRAGAHVEATLKARRRGQDGLSRRREITQRLIDDRLTSLCRSRGRVAARVARLAGARPLRRLFALRTRRRTYVVRHRGRRVAELTLDRTSVAAGRRLSPIERVEIEVVAGSPAVVARFVATLRGLRHLRAATRSKFETGLAAAGHAPPRH